MALRHMCVLQTLLTPAPTVWKDFLSPSMVQFITVGNNWMYNYHFQFPSSAATQIYIDQSDWRVEAHGRSRVVALGGLDTSCDITGPIQLHSRI